MSKDTIGKLLGVNFPQIHQHDKPELVINPELVMGLEIETENCKHGGGRYLDMVGPLGWNVTTDGSLRGQAFEFISLPMKHTHLVPRVVDFFQKTGFTEENYTDRCSIHVHVNCTNLTIDQLSSFCLVYSIFEEVLFDFVGGNRDSNIYCIPWNQCRYNQKLVTNLQKHLVAVPKSWQKYTAVNLVPLSNIGTVEFRHMHGTANVAKIRQWLSIIGCLFEYSTNNSFKDVFETVKMINTVSNYEQFFHQVLRDTLPYNTDSFLKLERGVISAKLAVIGYDPNKERTKEKSAYKKASIFSSTVDYAEDGAHFRVADAELMGEAIRAGEAVRDRIRQTNRIMPEIAPIGEIRPVGPTTRFRTRVINLIGTLSRADYQALYGNQMLMEYDRRAGVYLQNHPFATRQDVENFINSAEGRAL